MVSQADRELIRNFVTELRPYLESVDSGVEEFAQPTQDGVIVGQAVQALGMIRGAGLILIVDDLVAIASWLSEAFQRIQDNPNLAPEEAVRRLTGLTAAMRDCLAALDAGRDTAEIVQRAKAAFDAIPMYDGPRPGSGQLQPPSNLDALFGEDDAAFSAPTMPLMPVPAVDEEAPPAALEAEQHDEQDAPAVVLHDMVQPTDEIPRIDPELREIFLEEAVGLVASFGEHVRNIARQPTNVDVMDALRRDAHTLKGAASMTGFAIVGQVGRAVEHLLDEHIEHGIPITRDTLELLLVAWKMLRAMIQRMDDLNYFESSVESVVKRAEQLREVASSAAAQVQAAETATQVISEQPAIRRGAQDVPTDELVSIGAAAAPGPEPGDHEPASEAVEDDIAAEESVPVVEDATEHSPPEQDDPAQPASMDLEYAPHDDITRETPMPDFSNLEEFLLPVVEEAGEPEAYTEAEEEKPQTESFWTPGTDYLLKKAAQENALTPPLDDDVPEPQSEPFWSEGAADHIESDDEQATILLTDDPFFDPIVAEVEGAASEPVEPIEDDAGWFMAPATDGDPDVEPGIERPQTEPFWSGEAVEDPSALSNQMPEDEPISLDPFFEPVEDVPRPTLFADYLPSDEPLDEADTLAITETPFAAEQPDEEAGPVPFEYADEPDEQLADEEAPVKDEYLTSPVELDADETTPEPAAGEASSLVAGLMAGALAEAGEIAARHPATPQVDLAPESPENEEEPASDAGEDHLDVVAVTHEEAVTVSEAETPDVTSTEPEFGLEGEEIIPVEDQPADEFASLDGAEAPEWFEEPEDSDILTSDLSEADVKVDLEIEPEPAPAAEVDAHQEAAFQAQPGEMSIERFLAESGSAALSAALLDMAFTAGEAASVEDSAGPDISVFDAGSEAAIAAEMFETFRLESIDYLEVLNRAAMQIERDPGAPGPLADIRRALHTLKGAAAAAEIDTVVDRAHALEDVIEQLDESGIPGGQAPPERLVDELLGAVEDIERLLDEHRRNLFSDDSAPDGAAAGGDSSLRVGVARIDGLLNTVGELVVNRAGFEQRLERLAGSLDELTRTAERLQRSSSLLEREAYSGDTLSRIIRGELPGMSVPMIIGGQIGDWDELEMERYTEFDRMIRQLAEVGADISAAVGEITALRGDLDTVATRQRRLTSTLQDELMDIRMVPVSSIAPRLYRLVRRTAASRDKDVRLVVEGGETPFDKLVLDALSESLLHLLRNAVDHGIESPAERSLAGKPSSGTVRVRAYRDGSEAVIDIIDDGAGIDHERIIERARELGIEAPDGMSRHEALALIFRTGFSTRDEADELSGRGVGLDIVEQTVSRYKGWVTIDSIPGRGTIFSLRLPVMLSVIQAFLITAGGTQFAIPIASIEFVADRTDQPLTQIGNSVVVETANAIIPVIDLSARYGQSTTPIMERESGWVMVAEVAGQRWALAVDELHSQQEIVVKPLGRYLRHLPGMMGATILGNGEVALIVDVPQILGADSVAALAGSIEQISDGGWVPTGLSSNGASGPPDRKSHRRMALVVDDSLSVRRVVSHTLERYDWDVTLARDGVEALEILESEPVDVVITDIEMPRMDGFELLSAIRGRSEMEGLAVIILTSRSGEKHRNRALELGADDYLVKPFQEQKLLEVVGRAAGAIISGR